MTIEALVVDARSPSSKLGFFGNTDALNKVGSGTLKFSHLGKTPSGSICTICNSGALSPGGTGSVDYSSKLTQ